MPHARHSFPQFAQAALTLALCSVASAQSDIRDLVPLNPDLPPKQLIEQLERHALAFGKQRQANDPAVRTGVLLSSEFMRANKCNGPFLHLGEDSSRWGDIGFRTRDLPDKTKTSQPLIGAVGVGPKGLATLWCFGQTRSLSDELTQPEARFPSLEQPLRAGDLYVIKTARQGVFYRLRVIEHLDRVGVVVAWRPLRDQSFGERLSSPLLSGNTIRLQGRTQSSLKLDVSGWLKGISANRAAVPYTRPTLGQPGRPLLFVRGGEIPEGKVFLIDEVRWEAGLKGNAGIQIEAGECTVVEVFRHEPDAWVGSQAGWKSARMLSASDFPLTGRARPRTAAGDRLRLEGSIDGSVEIQIESQGSAYFDLKITGELVDVK